MDAFVKAVMGLDDVLRREHITALGKLNIKRFTTSKMIEYYLAFYKQIG